MEKKRSDKKGYTVAIIGAGWSGMGAQMDELRVKPASHAEAVVMNKQTKLVAFVDNDATALDLARRLYPDVPQFTSAEKMLASINPDIVIIATNPDTHVRYIELLARKKVRAILCEKPISHNLSEARRAVTVAKENGVFLFVNHIRRFDPLIRRFRDYVNGVHVRDTFLGTVRSASAYYNKGIFHGGTHHIDLLRFYLGEVAWVSAVPHPCGNPDPGDISVDCLLGFANGVTATLQYFDSAHYVLSEVSFFGEKGRLDLKHSAGLIIETTGTHSYRDISAYRELDYGSTKTFGAHRSYYQSVMPHIIGCIEGKDTPVSTGNDAVRALEVIKAIEVSSKGNGIIIKL